MNVTKKVARYIDDVGINLSELSRKAGVEYNALYASLRQTGRERALKADELTSICRVLKLNPMDFAGDAGEEVNVVNECSYENLAGLSKDSR